MAALALVAPLAAEDSQKVRVFITPESILLRATDNENTAEASFAAVANGEVRVCPNARFLIEALSQTGERTELAFAAEIKPILLRPAGDEHFVTAIIPMFVSWE